MSDFIAEDEQCKRYGNPVPISYRTIAVDLDGVLNMYCGWRGFYETFPVREGAAEFLLALKDRGYHLVCFTARPADDAKKWLEENGLMEFFDSITNEKIPALIYLDDRGVCFKGSFEQALCDIDSFKAHWEKP